MNRRPRRNHSPAFKAKVALADVKGEKSMVELAAKFNVHSKAIKAERDNEFAERLWRTIKYEEVNLQAYASVSEARTSLGRYIDGFSITRNPHSSPGRLTPDPACFNALPSFPLAA